MRTLLLLTFFFICLPAYGVEPCTKGTSDCTEWVTLGDQARSLIYRTYPLDTKNEKITRALVMVHGAGRDADNYFRTSVLQRFWQGHLMTRS